MKQLGRPAEGQYRISGMVDIPREFDDLALRRTKPFLDWAGVDTRPLSFLLKEAYRQGIADALQAMSSRGAQ